MSSKRKNRRKKKLAAELAKTLAEADQFADWSPKSKSADSHTLSWRNNLTPAERRQYDAEFQWARRAYREDLPGPRRITVYSEFY